MGYQGRGAGLGGARAAPLPWGYVQRGTNPTPWSVRTVQSQPMNLRTPGPTPLPPEVREALSRDMVNHRGAEFAEVIRECTEGLKWAFQTANDILILSTSGTGGLEAAVVNVLSPGERV